MQSKTVKVLRSEAKARGIKSYSRLNKQQLIDEIRSSPENPAFDLGSDAVFQYLVGNSRQSSAGINVNRETTLGYPAVWRATNLVSSTIARLPLLVYKRKPDGSKDRDTKHPAYRLLKKSPSQEMGSYIFFSTLMSHCLLHGNGYAFIFRSSDGSPTEFLILDPERTYLVRENGKPVYVTRINGEDRKLLFENVLHLKGASFDGLSGYSVISLLKESIGLGLAEQKYGSVFFKNNGRPSIVIEMSGALRDKEAIERFRSSWGNIHGGLDNAHKPAILENGATISSFAVNNEQAQFLQSRQFEIAQIANIFGVPPHKLGVDIATSYSSLEQENKSFLADLDGWLVMIEQECESKLLTEDQKQRDTHYIEFTRQALERADVQTETDVLTTELNNGAITLNQYLAIKNRPSAGPVGDKHRMPLNIGFVEDPPEPEPAMPPESPQEPVAASKGADDESPQDARAGALQGLLRATVARLVNRVTKQAQREAQKPTYQAWLASGLTADNERVFSESLDPVGVGVAQALLTDLRAELLTVANTTQALLDTLARITRDKPEDFTVKTMEQRWNAGLLQATT